METKERIRLFMFGLVMGLMGIGMLSADNGWGLLALIVGGGCVFGAFEKNKIKPPVYKYKGSRHYYEREK